MKNILHITIINYVKYYWTLKIFAIFFQIFLISIIQSWYKLMQSYIGQKHINIFIFSYRELDFLSNKIFHPYLKKKYEIQKFFREKLSIKHYL